MFNHIYLKKKDLNSFFNYLEYNVTRRKSIEFNHVDYSFYKHIVNAIDSFTYVPPRSDFKNESILLYKTIKQTCSNKGEMNFFSYMNQFYELQYNASYSINYRNPYKTIINSLSEEKSSSFIDWYTSQIKYRESLYQNFEFLSFLQRCKLNNSLHDNFYSFLQSNSTDSVQFFLPFYQLWYNLSYAYKINYTIIDWNIFYDYKKLFLIANSLNIENHYNMLSQIGTTALIQIKKDYLPDDIIHLFYKTVLITDKQYIKSLINSFINKYTELTQKRNNLTEIEHSISDFENRSNKSYNYINLDLMNSSGFNYKIQNIKQQYLYTNQKNLNINYDLSNSISKNFNSIEHIYPLNKLDSFSFFYNYLITRTRSPGYFGYLESKQLNEADIMNKYLYYNNFDSVKNNLLLSGIKNNYKTDIFNSFVNPFSILVDYDQSIIKIEKNRYLKHFINPNKYDLSYIRNTKYVSNIENEFIPNKEKVIGQYSKEHYVIEDYYNKVIDFLGLSFSMKENKTSLNIHETNTNKFINLFKNYLSQTNNQQYVDLMNVYSSQKYYNSKYFFKLLPYFIKKKEKNNFYTIKSKSFPIFYEKKPFLFSYINSNKFNYLSNLKYDFLKLYNYKFNYFNSNSLFSNKINFNFTSFNFFNLINFIIENPFIYILSIIQLIAINIYFVFNNFNILFELNDAFFFSIYELPKLININNFWYNFDYFLNFEKYLHLVDYFNIDKEKINPYNYSYSLIKTKLNDSFYELTNSHFSTYQPSTYFLNQYYFHLYNGKSIFKLPTYPNTNSLLVSFKWDNTSLFDLFNSYFILNNSYYSFFNSFYSYDLIHLILLFKKDIYFNIIDNNFFFFFSLLCSNLFIILNEFFFFFFNLNLYNIKVFTQFLFKFIKHYISYFLILHQSIINNIYFLNLHYVFYKIPVFFIQEVSRFIQTNIIEGIKHIIYFENNYYKLQYTIPSFYKYITISFKFYFIDHFYYYYQNKAYGSFALFYYYLLLLPLYYIIKIIYFMLVFEFFLLVIFFIFFIFYKFSFFSKIKNNLWLISEYNIKDINFRKWHASFHIINKYYNHFFLNSIKINKLNQGNEISFFDLSRQLNKQQGISNFISWHPTMQSLDSRNKDISMYNFHTTDYLNQTDLNTEGNKSYFFKYIYLNNRYMELKDKYYNNLHFNKIPVLPIGTGYNWNVYRKHIYHLNSIFTLNLFTEQSDFFAPLILMGKLIYDSNAISNNVNTHITMNDLISRIHSNNRLDNLTRIAHILYRYEPLMADFFYIKKKRIVKLNLYKHPFQKAVAENEFANNLFTKYFLWDIGMENISNTMGSSNAIDNRYNTEVVSHSRLLDYYSLGRIKTKYKKGSFKYQLGESKNDFGFWMEHETQIPNRLVSLSNITLNSLFYYQRYFKEVYALNEFEFEKKALEWVAVKYNYIPNRYKKKEFMYWFQNNYLKKENMHNIENLINSYSLENLLIGTNKQYISFNIENTTESYLFSFIWNRFSNLKLATYGSLLDNELIEYYLNFEDVGLSKNSEYNIVKSINNLWHDDPAILYPLLKDSYENTEEIYFPILKKIRLFWQYKYFINNRYAGKSSRIRSYNEQYNSELIPNKKDKYLHHYFHKANLIGNYGTKTDQLFDAQGIEHNWKFFKWYCDFKFNPFRNEDAKYLGLTLNSESNIIYFNNLISNDLFFNQGLFHSFFPEFSEMTIEFYYLWLISQFNSKININHLKKELEKNYSYNNYNSSYLNDSIYNMNMLYDYSQFTRQQNFILDEELYDFWTRSYKGNRRLHQNKMRNYGNEENPNESMESLMEEKRYENDNKQIPFYLYPYSVDYLEYEYETDRYLNLWDRRFIRLRELFLWGQKWKTPNFRRESPDAPLVVNHTYALHLFNSISASYNDFPNDIFLSIYPYHVNKQIRKRTSFLNNKFNRNSELTDHFFNYIDFTKLLVFNKQNEFFFYKIPSELVNKWSEIENKSLYYSYYDIDQLNNIKMNAMNNYGGSWKYHYFDVVLNTKQYDYIFEDILIQKYGSLSGDELDLELIKRYCEENITGALLIKDHLIYNEKLKSISPESSFFFDSFYNEYTWEIYEFDLFKEIKSNFFYIIPILIIVLLYYFGKPIFYFIPIKRSKRTFFNRKAKRAKQYTIKKTNHRYNALKRYTFRYYKSQSNNLINPFGVIFRNNHKRNLPTLFENELYLDSFNLRRYISPRKRPDIRKNKHKFLNKKKQIIYSGNVLYKSLNDKYKTYRMSYSRKKRPSHFHIHNPYKHEYVDSMYLNTQFHFYLYDSQLNPSRLSDTEIKLQHKPKRLRKKHVLNQKWNSKRRISKYKKKNLYLYNYNSYINMVLNDINVIFFKLKLIIVYFFNIINVMIKHIFKYNYSFKEIQSLLLYLYKNNNFFFPFFNNIINYFTLYLYPKVMNLFYRLAYRNLDNYANGYIFRLSPKYYHHRKRRYKKSQNHNRYNYRFDSLIHFFVTLFLYISSIWKFLFKILIKSVYSIYYFINYQTIEIRKKYSYFNTLASFSMNFSSYNFNFISFFILILKKSSFFLIKYFFFLFIYIYINFLYFVNYIYLKTYIIFNFFLFIFKLFYPLFNIFIYLLNTILAVFFFSLFKLFSFFYFFYFYFYSILGSIYYNFTFLIKLKINYFILYMQFIFFKLFNIAVLYLKLIYSFMSRLIIFKYINVLFYYLIKIVFFFLFLLYYFILILYNKFAFFISNVYFLLYIKQIQMIIYKIILYVFNVKYTIKYIIYKICFIINPNIFIKYINFATAKLMYLINMFGLIIKQILYIIYLIVYFTLNTYNIILYIIICICFILLKQFYLLSYNLVLFVIYLKKIIVSLTILAYSFYKINCLILYPFLIIIKFVYLCIKISFISFFKLWILILFSFYNIITNFLIILMNNINGINLLNLYREYILCLKNELFNLMFEIYCFFKYVYFAYIHYLIEISTYLYNYLSNYIFYINLEIEYYCLLIYLNLMIS